MSDRSPACRRAVGRARATCDTRIVAFDASFYASSKLAEVESRSHYVHKLHGEP